MAVSAPWIRNWLYTTDTYIYTCALRVGPGPYVCRLFQTRLEPAKSES